MTKITSFFLLLSSLAMFTSCNSNTSYKKTASGIMYQVASKGDGPLVKKGELLKFHYSQKLNDSLMFSSFSSIPTYAKVDSVGAIYSPLEVLEFLHKGDSVIIVQLADTIMKKMPPGQQSPLKKGDKVTLTLKILDILKTDELAQADQANELKSETTRELSTIENYLASKKIATQKTEKGVFVAIQSAGEGATVDSGKFVSVNYTGKLFPAEKVTTEKVFESNVGKDPIQFTINSGQVIPGWDEGLKMLKKGGKATLYIPATLAYGQQPGPGGKPFENLIFDVEVVDVADKAPAPKQLPEMPGQPQIPGQQNPNQQNPNQQNPNQQNPNQQNPNQQNPPRGN
ncbi:MAG: FKBP-type peptidyl-prolyl cis-trans isomerase [Chitinophagaceae bacterium]